MITTGENVFLDWHCTATNYHEFLNQRIHSALAYQISLLDRESLRLLPAAGVIACIPSLLADGEVDSPALNLWVEGVDGQRLVSLKAEWEIREIRPFSSIDEFLKFEQVFLDLNSDRDKTWEILDHEERVITAISFMGLLKPLEWIFCRTSTSQSPQWLPGSH